METLVKYPEKYFHEWEERVVFILKHEVHNWGLKTQRKGFLFPGFVPSIYSDNNCDHLQQMFSCVLATKQFNNLSLL